MSPAQPVGAIGATADQYTADLPADLDPGFINVKIRANGLESNVETLDSVVPENAVFIRRQGQAMYQKVEVTDTGLDLSRPVFVPDPSCPSGNLRPDIAAGRFRCGNR